MSSAREQILNRIRQARRTPEVESYEAIPRPYRQASSLAAAARVALFEERLRDYEARVFRTPPEQIRATITAALAMREKGSLLVPPGIPRDWLPDTIRFETDDALENTALDGSEGVLTGCALAIASTGTIVLRHSKSKGRRASTLIPDYHLCVVYEGQVVETVAEGVQIMAQFGRTPMTTISGPSATSDIEMTRIKGVHGPRTLDVILACT